MANKLDLVSHSPAWCVSGDTYWFWVKFDTNSTSAPDGVDPAVSDGLTIARSGVGVYTITFPENKKPLEVLWCGPVVIGDVTLKAAFTSYVASTGVLTISVHDIDGTPAVADSTDKEVRVAALCTRVDNGATS